MKLSYYNPSFEKGLEVGITGLDGLVKNGEPFEVSDEQAKQFKARTGNSLSDVVDKNSNFEKEKGGAK